jgi:cysteinyl-tRNA synthetase
MAERHAAREGKNFGEADRLRNELNAMGIVLRDKKDPETGKVVTEWEMVR